ncbi:metallophosphoesterase [Anaerosacchariphilus polymeriproducens]|uniref:Serine/threonine protein phosphatase n=1 Tax=Anaerosacchariphilus polymeriproducens TaxID=1812858 RepID=A0A371AZK3_9FIRM|nr:metallophosphoesterase [Anaerosacchariphilus polymeriproducens]RDU24910.1 serine/threonine protein phosphatase [Anaerosacchariphilus polymeriproducens]
MKTERRLNNTYKNAEKIYFDNNSKYIFFSDMHRGDDSVSDEFTRNQNVFLHALNYYYKEGYEYIEVGDGDELWEYKNFSVIRLAHSDVFTVIKKFYDEGRFIMLYGNHNIYLKSKRFIKNNYYQYYDEYNQKRVDLFRGLEPKEAIILKHKKTKQKIFVLHGHQGDFMNDQFWVFSMLLLRYFWRYLHIVGFDNPTSPARNLYKRHKVEKVYSKWIEKHKIMIICGHTHRPKFPKVNELPYFNLGCCTRTRGIAGIEIVNGKILMVDWRIAAAENGELKIHRTVVRGPEPIEKFNSKNNQYPIHCKRN